MENAGVENTVAIMYGKPSNRKQKFSKFLIKGPSTRHPLVSSTTELTGLVPGVGVLLLEADSESDSDSGQEPRLRGTPNPRPLSIRVFNCLRLWCVYKYAIVWTARLCLKLSHRPNTNIVAKKPPICKKKQSLLLLAKQ